MAEFGSLIFEPRFEDRTPQPRPVQRGILDDLFRGLLESAARGVSAPGRALSGGYHVAPETPGQWSEADEFRRRSADQKMLSDSMDFGGLVMGGGLPAGAGASAAGGVSLGIVPVDAARAFGIKPNLPTSDVFQAAVKNTPGALIDDGMLLMNLQRRQKPEQEMMDSVRGGVFYLPEGAAQMKHYSTPKNYYGGTQKIEGQSGFANPLFVKGATGGKAPEAAFDTLNGKGAFDRMERDALGAIFTRDKAVQEETVTKFLEKYAPELADNAYSIIRNSSQGNQLAYALKEAGVASAARRAGHDAVIGYSTSRKTKEPFLSEVFDVRERSYPGPDDFDVWPRDMFGSLGAK